LSFIYPLVIFNDKIPYLNYITQKEDYYEI
jgi:hypothetical protein